MRHAWVVAFAALFIAIQVGEAVGERYWLASTLCIGLVGGVAWHWLHPRTLAERAWFWALLPIAALIAAIGNEPVDEEIVTRLLAMLGIVGGHLLAERFEWQRIPAAEPQLARVERGARG